MSQQRRTLSLSLNNIFQQWEPRISTVAEKRPPVMQVVYLRRNHATQKTDMDGHIRCSLLTLERDVHKKKTKTNELPPTVRTYAQARFACRSSREFKTSMSLYVYTIHTFLSPGNALNIKGSAPTVFITV
jgi:hypothetical protein